MQARRTITWMDLNRHFFATIKVHRGWCIKITSKSTAGFLVAPRSLADSVHSLLAFFSDIFISGKKVVISAERWQHFCQKWNISFSSSNTQFYESRIFCLFTFWVFFPDKSFKTLNWGKWNSGFVKLGVRWAERDINIGKICKQTITWTDLK